MERIVTCVVAIILGLVVCFVLVPFNEHNQFFGTTTGKLKISHKWFGFYETTKIVDTPLSQALESQLGNQSSDAKWILVRANEEKFYVYSIKICLRQASLLVLQGFVANMAAGKPPYSWYSPPYPGLTDDGKKEFLRRFMASSTDSRDSEPAQRYFSRSLYVMAWLDHPAGPSDFPTVDEALDDALWEKTWGVWIEEKKQPD